MTDTGNKAIAALGTLYEALGLDLGEATATRHLKALAEMTQGILLHEGELVDMLKTFPAPPDPGIVVVKDIPFSSLCEHHMLPFAGTVSVAYLPGTEIIGLSKIPRLVRMVAARPQVQERIGQMVADAVYSKVRCAGKPTGSAVVVRAEHTCMAHRGARSRGIMVTSCMRGVFRADAQARAEVMGLIGS
jgi:GTP cyclohydrolase I